MVVFEGGLILCFCLLSFWPDREEDDIVLPDKQGRLGAPRLCQTGIMRVSLISQCNEFKGLPNGNRRFYGFMDGSKGVVFRILYSTTFS